MNKPSASGWLRPSLWSTLCILTFLLSQLALIKAQTLPEGCIASCDMSRAAIFRELEGFGAHDNSLVDTFTSSSCEMVVVSTFEGLKSELTDDTCKWIKIQGTIQLGDERILVGSNKLLDGLSCRGELVGPTIAGTNKAPREPLQWMSKNNAVVIGVKFSRFNLLPERDRSWRYYSQRCECGTQAPMSEFLDCKACKDDPPSPTERERCDTDHWATTNTPRVCRCGLDKFNEVKALIFIASTHIWVHRCTFEFVGEAITVNDNDAGTVQSEHVTLSYNYFHSVFDSVSLQSNTGFTAHHNAFVNCNRRSPKCNSVTARCHVYNNAIVNWLNEGREVQRGSDYDEQGFWQYDPAWPPVAITGNGEAGTTCTSTVHNVLTRFPPSSALVVPPSLCRSGLLATFDSIMVDYPFVTHVGPHLFGSCVSNANRRKCVQRRNWWTRLLRSNSSPNLNTVRSKQTGCDNTAQRPCTSSGANADAEADAADDDGEADDGNDDVTADDDSSSSTTTGKAAKVRPVRKGCFQLTGSPLTNGQFRAPGRICRLRPYRNCVPNVDPTELNLSGSVFNCPARS
jgi:hypothetical protein